MKPSFMYRRFGGDSHRCCPASNQRRARPFTEIATPDWARLIQRFSNHMARRTLGGHGKPDSLDGEQGIVLWQMTGTAARRGDRGWGANWWVDLSRRPDDSGV